MEGKVKVIMTNYKWEKINLMCVGNSTN